LSTKENKRMEEVNILLRKQIAISYPNIRDHDLRNAIKHAGGTIHAVQNMSEIEVAEACGRNVPMQKYIAMYTALGAPMRLARRLFDCYNRIDNMDRQAARIGFCKYIRKLLLLIDVTSEPLPEDIMAFENWILGIRQSPGVRSKLCQLLRGCGAHSHYIGLVEEPILDIDPVWNLYRKRHRGEQLTDKASARKFIRDIMNTTRQTTILTCSSTLTLAQATSLATSADFKPRLLILTGCTHPVQTIRDSYLFDRKRYEAMHTRAGIKTRFSFNVYAALEIALGCKIDDIDYSPAEVCRRVCVLPSGSCVFGVLSLYLDPQILKQFLPQRFTGVVSSARHIEISNPWTKVMMENIFTSVHKQLKETSAYTERALRLFKDTTWRLVSFINIYAEDFSVTTPDPLRYLFSTATVSTIEDILVMYGQQLNVDNTRVRSTLQEHHAKRAISHAVAIFKKHFAPYMMADMQTLGLQNILARVLNRREAMSESKRRTYSEVEMDGMKAVCKDNPMERFLITLLEQYAPRSGCILGLKYHQFFNALHEPRPSCRVLEKGNVFRDILVSEDLFSALQVLSAHIRQQHTGDIRQAHLPRLC
jgi:hypothetical protein